MGGRIVLVFGHHSFGFRAQALSPCVLCVTLGGEGRGRQGKGGDLDNIAGCGDANIHANRVDRHQWQGTYFPLIKRRFREEGFEMPLLLLLRELFLSYFPFTASSLCAFVC